jgi:glutaredoxin-like protein NrdH
MNITVYTKPVCPSCDSAKSYLTDYREVEFETKDITEDSEAMDYVKSLGAMSTPVIVVEGHEPILGFDRGKLDEIFDEE